MYRRTIKYKDFNDEEVEEVLYFNLTKSEIISLNLGAKGGLEALIIRLIETTDIESVFKTIQEIILAAYGVKSDDGRQFIKSDEVRDSFRWSLAFDALVMEFMDNEEKFVEWIKGVVPSDILTDENFKSIRTEDIFKTGKIPQRANVEKIPDKPLGPPRQTR